MLLPHHLPEAILGKAYLSLGSKERWISPQASSAHTLEQAPRLHPMTPKSTMTRFIMGDSYAPWAKVGSCKSQNEMSAKQMLSLEDGLTTAFHDASAFAGQYSQWLWQGLWLSSYTQKDSNSALYECNT